MIFCAVVPRLFFEFVFLFFSGRAHFWDEMSDTRDECRILGINRRFYYLYALGQTPVCFRKKAEKFCWDPYPQ